MKPKVRRLVVIVGASAALGAAGCGGAGSTQSSAQSGGTGSSQSQSSANGAQAQPGPGGFDLAALATRLGVSESKLRAAMAKTRPTGTPGQAPSDTNADPAGALAKQLGLSATKVRAAMQALRPSGAPQQQTSYRRARRCREIPTRPSNRPSRTGRWPSRSVRSPKTSCRRCWRSIRADSERGLVLPIDPTVGSVRSSIGRGAPSRADTCWGALALIPSS